MERLRNPVSLLKVLLFGAFLALPELIIAQRSEIDTSGYLPLIYNGALEYNLMQAAASGYTSEVARMISQGADVDAETAEGATALVLAVAAYHPGTVELLLGNNADPNKITRKNETPLLITIKYRNTEQIRISSPIVEAIIDSSGMAIAESLIRSGADIDFQDNYGATPLNYASIYGYVGFVDMLIYYGADVNKKAYDGTTPLMAAIWAGFDDVADLLIRNGANLESKDNDGYTPFLIAAQNGDTVALDLLLKNGVDLYEKNNENWDALDISIRAGYKDVSEWLIKKGDKWGDTGRDHVNYYNVAANYKRKEIFELLEKENFPSKYRPHLNQMDLSISSKFNLWDIFTGFSLAFKEPLLNMGVIAGFDTKLWYTSVLIKEKANIYTQYMDKSSVAYAGVFRDIKLTDNLLKSNIYFSPSLSGAYYIGNKFKGTQLSPESKFKVIPAINFKFENKNFVISSGIELMTTGFERIIPLWIRVGYSHKFYFDPVKTQGKKIRWY